MHATGIFSVEPAGLDHRAGPPLPRGASRVSGGETSVLPLPTKLNGDAAAGLHAMLQERAGQAICLDAIDVAELGGLCLQVLLSAVAGSGAAQAPVELRNLSNDMRRALQVFGVTPDQIGLQEGTNGT